MADVNTSFMNRVLTICGADLVTDYTDNLKRAKNVRVHFEPVRKFLQEKYQWNFCARRATISAHPVGPDHGFTYRFLLPSGCVRVWRIKDSKTYSWHVESGYILTNNPGPIEVRYGAEETNPGTWSGMFGDLFVYEVALRAAPKVAQDRGTLADIKDVLRDLRGQAVDVDALERDGDDPDDEAPDYPWQREYER